MMNNAGEPILVCPYNKAHSIIKSRMQFHLAKCRKQSPHSETATCPYNSTHVVAKVELEFHEMICENRIVLDSFVFNVGSSKCPVEEVPLNAPPEVLAPCEENWDEERVPSVLEVVKEKAREKTVLLNLIGAPKAERKAHRVQERLRFQRVADAQEADKKKKEKGRNTNQKGTGTKVTSEPETENAISDDPKCKASEEEMLSLNRKVPSSNSDTDSDQKTTDTIQEPQDNSYNDDFEVVNYHKKSKAKKGKQQMNHPMPPSTSVNKYEQGSVNITENEIEEQIRNLKIDKKLPNETAEQQYVRRAPDIKLTVNAWEKPLNIAGGVTSQAAASGRPMTFRPVDDFPSLPVSGRGRGIHLKKY